MHIFLMQRLNNLGQNYRAHAPVGNYKATVLGLQASMQAHVYNNKLTCIWSSVFAGEMAQRSLDDRGYRFLQTKQSDRT